MWTQFWVRLCLHLGCPNKNKSVFVKVLVVLICILVAKSYIHTNLLLRQQWEQFAYRWDCTESAYFIAIPTVTEFGKCPMSEKPSRPLHSDPQSCKCTGAGTEWCLCWFQWASWDYLLWKMWLHMLHMNMITAYQNIGCFLFFETREVCYALRMPLFSTVSINVIQYHEYYLGKFHFTNASLYKVCKSALGLLKSAVDKQICIVSAYGLSSNNKSLYHLPTCSHKDALF